MATLSTIGALGSGVVILSTAQTGNGASTNVADRGPSVGPGLLTIVSVAGGTPALSIDIQGSVDNADWWNVAYATQAAPETVAVAQISTITTSTTTRFILRPYHPWRYLRLFYSANVNLTITATFAMPNYSPSGTFI
jgi:hypothetical protein